MQLGHMLQSQRPSEMLACMPPCSMRAAHMWKNPLEVVQELALSHAARVPPHLHAVLADDGCRHGGLDEGREAGKASGRDHLLDLCITAAVVAGHEAANSKNESCFQRSLQPGRPNWR